MDLSLIVGATGLVLAYLAWRYPRAPSTPTHTAPAEEQAKDEGLALVLALILAARKRRKDRAEKG
jgi:hypothetical protein